MIISYQDKILSKISRARIQRMKKVIHDFKEYGAFCIDIGFTVLFILVGVVQLLERGGYKGVADIFIVIGIIVGGGTFVLAFFWGIYGVSEIVKGIKSVKAQCEIPIFDRLDTFLKTRNKNVNCDYLAILNYYYSKNGVINKVYHRDKQQKLGVLIQRKDYLQSKENRFQDFNKNIISILVSLCVSIMTMGMMKYIQQIQNNSTDAFLVFYVIATLVMMLVIMAGTRGHLGSYDYIINEYEMKLLDQMIENDGKSITISKKDHPFIEMKQFVLSYLKKQTKKIFILGKNRAALYEDMDQICKLKIGYKKSKKHLEENFMKDSALKFYNNEELNNNTKKKESDEDKLASYIKKYENGLKKYYKELSKKFNFDQVYSNQITE